MISRRDWVSYTALTGVVVTISYFSLRQPQRDFLVSMSDKAGHLLAYFTLFVVLRLAFPKLGTLRAIAICVAYSLVMECLQYFIPLRKFEMLDMLANTTGVLLGVGLIALSNRLLPGRYRI